MPLGLKRPKRPAATEAGAEPEPTRSRPGLRLPGLRLAKLRPRWRGPALLLGAGLVLLVAPLLVAALKGGGEEATGRAAIDGAGTAPSAVATIETPAPPAAPGVGAKPATLTFGNPGNGPAAPAPDLFEQSPDGPLPRIAMDGRQAWKLYARPAPASDTTPKIALLLTELGPSVSGIEAAIDHTPPEVTLGVLAYASGVGTVMDRARTRGHELVLAVPMEPQSGADDPGPHALFIKADAAENMRRLNWTLARGTGYVGVTDHLGEAFVGSAASFGPIAHALKERGLLYVESRPAAAAAALAATKAEQTPVVAADLVLDQQPDAAALDKQLAALEALARKNGQALGVMTAQYPVLLERAVAWTQTLKDKGMVLVPAASLARVQ